MSYISSSPASGAVDVQLDVVVKVLFSKQLSDKSLNRNVFILVDDVSSRQLNCSFGQTQLPGGQWEVSVMPQRLLALNTAHKMYIIGADDDTAPMPVTFVDGTTMALSQELTWKTGEQLQASAEARDRDSAVNFPLVLDGTTDLSQFMPGQVQPDVQVVTQYPAESDIAVLVDQKEVSITFNGPVLGYGPISAPLTTQDALSKIMSFGVEPLLSQFVLYAPKTQSFFTPAPLGQPRPAGWGVPAGVWSISGPTITYTINDGEFWPANAVISVKIGRDTVVMVGGQPTAYGLADHKFRFAIEIYPSFTHANMVRSMIGSVNSQVSDLAIQQAILQSSMEAWRYALRAGSVPATVGRVNGIYTPMAPYPPTVQKPSLHDPSWAAQTYARLASVARVLDNYALTLEALRGRNMKLGDLSVSYMPNQASALSGMLKDIKSDLPMLAETLSIEGGGVGFFAVGVTGQNTFRPRYMARNWDLGSRVPWANTTQERSLYLATPTHVPVLEMF